MNGPATTTTTPTTTATTLGQQQQKGGNGNMASIVTEDPVLRLLMEDLRLEHARENNAEGEGDLGVDDDGRDDQQRRKIRSFNRWRASFLERYESFLSEETVAVANTTTASGPTTSATLAARTVYEEFQSEVTGLIKLLQRLRWHLRRNDLSLHRQQPRAVSVKARRCLKDLQIQMRCVVVLLQKLLPLTRDDEHAVGFTKYHMGALLVKTGFTEYTRIVLAREVTARFPLHPILLVQADKQLLEECDYFIQHVQIFCDILADLQIGCILERGRAVSGGAVMSDDEIRKEADALILAGVAATSEGTCAGESYDCGYDFSSHTDIDSTEGYYGDDFNGDDDGNNDWLHKSCLSFSFGDDDFNDNELKETEGGDGRKDAYQVVDSDDDDGCPSFTSSSSDDDDDDCLSLTSSSSDEKDDGDDDDGKSVFSNASSSTTSPVSSPAPRPRKAVNMPSPVYSPTTRSPRIFHDSKPVTRIGPIRYDHGTPRDWCISSPPQKGSRENRDDHAPGGRKIAKALGGGKHFAPCLDDDDDVTGHTAACTSSCEDGNDCNDVSSSFGSLEEGFDDEDGNLLFPTSTEKDEDQPEIVRLDIRRYQSCKVIVNNEHPEGKRADVVGSEPSSSSSSHCGWMAYVNFDEHAVAASVEDAAVASSVSRAADALVDLPMLYDGPRPNVSLLQLARSGRGKASIVLLPEMAVSQQRKDRVGGRNYNWGMYRNFVDAVRSRILEAQQQHGNANPRNSEIDPTFCRFVAVDADADAPATAAVTELEYGAMGTFRRRAFRL